MGKLLKINMVGTAIKELPRSISKLSRLNYLDMTCCMGLQNLPSSLFKLPNFVTLKIGACSQLPESVRRLKESHSLAECSPCLETLHFGYAGLSNEDIHVIIDTFPNLRDLNVSGNKFVSLPAHIKESIYLTSLDVSRCKKLENIPDLPSSIQKVDARFCNSLSRKTSRMLWSQVHKEINRLEVYMPDLRLQDREETLVAETLEEIERGVGEIDQENEEAVVEYALKMIAIARIPRQFDYRDNGGIPVFRARKKFPIVALAFVFGREKYEPYHIACEWHGVDLHLFIDGERVHSKRYSKFIVAENHVLLCDLRVLLSEEEWEVLDARVGGQDWKTVQVDYEANLSLHCWGVYVYKQETNMEDIEFKIPDPCSSGIRKPRPFVPLSEEDQMRNRIASSDLPAIFEVLLKKEEEEEDLIHRCLEFIMEHEVGTIMATAGLWRMSRRVMALREGKVTSVSRLDEDTDEEDDRLFQMFFSDDDNVRLNFTCSDMFAEAFSRWKQWLCCEY